MPDSPDPAHPHPPGFDAVIDGALARYTSMGGTYPGPGPSGNPTGGSRTPPAAPEVSAGSVDAVLARIDAAIGQRCVCGCRRLITDGGPSAWYAGPDCQRQWLGRNHATDPDDVYRRPDAVVYRSRDAATWPQPTTSIGTDVEPAVPVGDAQLLIAMVAPRTNWRELFRNLTIT